MERAISNNELREAVDFSRMRGQRSVVEWHCSINWSLKGQYPVTAHAPNFDFQTGCRKIKRCEEKKRTLKNPFASRFAEFNTTLKLLMITDQWYIVPVKPRFGRGRDFCGVTFIVVGRRSKWWKGPNGWITNEKGESSIFKAPWRIFYGDVWGEARISWRSFS